jgi:hypothetical protein
MISFCYIFSDILKEKSDAQVGRVNTFHILQTIRKRPSKFRFCMERPLRFLKFKILSNVVKFFDPELLNKSATRFILRWYLLNKLSFPRSESEFAWEVPIGLEISKFWVRSFVSGPQITEQKYHQINSTLKFVE